MQWDIDGGYGLSKAVGRHDSNQDISRQAGSNLHSFQSEDELLELNVEGKQEMSVREKREGY